jgi:hypothetical protein
MEFVDYNKFSLDEHCEILEHQFGNGSQGYVKSIFELIKFYREHKVKEFHKSDVLSSLLPSKERVEVSNMVMKILTENTHIVDGQVRGVIVHGAVEKLTDIIMEMRKQIA